MHLNDSFIIFFQDTIDTIYIILMHILCQNQEIGELLCLKEVVIYIVSYDCTFLIQ